MNSIRQIPKFLFVGLPITMLGQVTEARFPKKNLNVYTTKLKHGKNDSKDYAKKLEEMKKHNFE